MAGSVFSPGLISRLRITCLRASTGKEFFPERIGAPGQYIASPIAAGDKLVVASVPGVVTVIEVDDKPNVPAKNKFGEKIFTTPVIAENNIYLYGRPFICPRKVKGMGKSSDSPALYRTYLPAMPWR